MRRRDLLQIASATAVSFAVSPSSWAKELAQVSAVQRFKIGDSVVTALSDGFFQMDASLFPEVDDDGFKAALLAAFQDPTVFLAAVNAYVIDDGTDVHIIDSGTGSVFGPTLGKLPKTLAAAGYSPEQVKSLIVTHLHPDHIGGAVKDGKPVYPNAEMVVNGTDHAFWTDPANQAKSPDSVKPFFDLAMAAVQGYEGRVRLFEGEADILPGITAYPLPGHTPGHTGFVLASGNDAVLFWGDVVHMPALQVADPAVSIVFDVDPETAKKTRQTVMDRAATDRIMVAGMHMDFPGIGYLERRDKGYHFVPAGWEYQ
jgi:glyoxylase-like metal-dependent hydrolase (beta-lactamase superfamily II)